jgi:hypothetical protein
MKGRQNKELDVVIMWGSCKKITVPAFVIQITNR